MDTDERTIAFDAELLADVERRLAASGGDLSGFVNDTVAGALRRGALPGAAAASEAPTLADRSAAYAAALLERDARRAAAVVEVAVIDGVEPADLYAAVMAPALRQVGHLWAVDEINVADEHFATSVTQELLGTLASDKGREPARAGRLAVVTGSPDELHVLGALMVADLLVRDGWEVLGLGAATPADDLVELVENECPDVVAVSTTTAGRVPGLEDAIRKLVAVRPRPLIAVGGGFCTPEASEFVRGLGADLVTSDVRALLGALGERFPRAGADAGPAA